MDPKENTCLSYLLVILHALQFEVVKFVDGIATFRTQKVLLFSPTNRYMEQVLYLELIFFVMMFFIANIDEPFLASDVVVLLPTETAETTV